MARRAMRLKLQVKNALFFDGYFVERAGVRDDSNAAPEPDFFEQKACAMITAVLFVRGYREAE